MPFQFCANRWDCSAPALRPELGDPAVRGTRLRGSVESLRLTLPNFLASNIGTRQRGSLSLSSLFLTLSARDCLGEGRRRWRRAWTVFPAPRQPIRERLGPSGVPRRCRRRRRTLRRAEFPATRPPGGPASLPRPLPGAGRTSAAVQTLLISPASFLPQPRASQRSALFF